MKFKSRTFGGRAMDGCWLSAPFVDGVGYQITRREDGMYLLERLTWMPSEGGGGTHRHEDLGIYASRVEAEVAARIDA